MIDRYVIEVLRVEETRLLEKLADVREALCKLTAVEPKDPEHKTVKEWIVEALQGDCLSNQVIWEFLKVKRPGMTKQSTSSRLSQLAREGIIVKVKDGADGGKWKLQGKSSR